MKKIYLALCFVLAFVGISGFFEVKKAEAVLVGVNFESKTVITMTNAQLRNENVYSFGTAVGPNNPPIAGGKIVIIDIVDRTQYQLIYLGSCLGGCPGDPRYVFKFVGDSQWISDQLYRKGFITIKWSQIRGSIWDKKLDRFLTGAWRWTSATGKKMDECLLNCDYQYCEVVGYNWSDLVSFCDCEEWQGRWFCHKKNFFKYSSKRDQN